MPDLKPFESSSADHLRLVLEVSQIGIWELDLASGLAVRNRTHDKIFGYDEPLDEWSYELFLEHVLERDRARVDALQSAAVAEHKEWVFECQIATANGDYRWIRAAGCPLFGDGGEVTRLIGHVIDITDSKQNQARLLLITEELNHRVRNMLAVIKSMISMTARRSRGVDELAQALEGRVGALARTHNLLVNSAGTSMLPSEIVKTELGALGDSGSRVRVEVKGEARLSSSAGQGLALVIHELLTNAAKYGGLSSANGTIEVTIDRTGSTVDITWVERGGPPADPAPNEGFGSILILNALGSEGTVEQDFSDEGLTCRIALNTA